MIHLAISIGSLIFSIGAFVFVIWNGRKIKRINRSECIVADDAPDQTLPQPMSNRRERRALERSLRRTSRTDQEHDQEGPS